MTRPTFGRRGASKAQAVPVPRRRMTEREDVSSDLRSSVLLQPPVDDLRDVPFTREHRSAAPKDKKAEDFKNGCIGLAVLCVLGVFMFSGGDDDSPAATAVASSRDDTGPRRADPEMERLTKATAASLGYWCGGVVAVTPDYRGSDANAHHYGIMCDDGSIAERYILTVNPNNGATTLVQN